VILDIEHSGNSECDLCRKIAKSIPNAPLIIRSTSSDAADKVLFLAIGADDHVTIRFSPGEPIPRLHALTASQACVALPSESMRGSVRVTFKPSPSARSRTTNGLSPENLHNRYFLLTTAKPREGMFFPMVDTQT
jgi:DNA-binding response OmpR family regulator